jgi:hypothetical protein
LAFIPNKDNFTEVVDIVLYKYNAIDAKLWSLICRSGLVRKVSRDSLVIGTGELRNIMLRNFSSEINKFRVVEDSMLYKDATSIYFIWKMMEEMHNLTWLKINLSLNAKYSRIIAVDQLKTIRFSTKIVRGTFRTFDHFKQHDMTLVNIILYRAKLLVNGRPYYRVKLVDMLNSLDMYMSEHNTTEVGRVVDLVISQLERFENDNPEVLIITDYNSDI